MISKKKLRAAAAFLALVLVALAIVPAGPALAVSQSEIDALEEQRDALKAEREEMQAGIDELKNEQAGVLEQKRALDEQNEVYRQELELIEEQVSLYTRLVDEKAAELEKATAAETEQLAIYKQHVRAMEENGNYTYLSIIFGSKSLSELMANLDMIGEIMEAVGDEVKIKGSGCIRTREHFLKLIDMGIDRMGVGYKSTPVVLGLK